MFLGSLDNIIGAMDMIFPGLSNAIDIDPDTLDMLSTYITPEDFLSSDQKDIEKYVSMRHSEKNKEDCFWLTWKSVHGKITEDGYILTYQNTESTH